MAILLGSIPKYKLKALQDFNPTITFVTLADTSMFDGLLDDGTVGEDCQIVMVILPEPDLISNFPKLGLDKGPWE